MTKKVHSKLEKIKKVINEELSSEELVPMQEEELLEEVASYCDDLIESLSEDRGYF